MGRRLKLQYDNSMKIKYRCLNSLRYPKSNVSRAYVCLRLTWYCMYCHLHLHSLHCKVSTIIKQSFKNVKVSWKSSDWEYWLNLTFTTIREFINNNHLQFIWFFLFMKIFVFENSLKELDYPNQTLLLANTYTSVFGFAYYARNCKIRIWTFYR